MAMAGPAGQERPADVLVWLARDFVTWCVGRKLDKLAARPPRVCAALARVGGSDRGRGRLCLPVPQLLSALRRRAFSSEVDTGSREENASKQKAGARF